MSPRLRALTLALVTCAAVVVLDQASKQAVVSEIARGDSVELLPFLDLTNTRNRGIAFGLAGDVSPALVGASLLLLIGLLTFLAVRTGARAVWLPAALLIGGALGNLADRVRDGAVIDFIDLPLWATFNLADVAIVVGVALLVLMPDREQPGE